MIVFARGLSLTRLGCEDIRGCVGLCLHQSFAPGQSYKAAV